MNNPCPQELLSVLITKSDEIATLKQEIMEKAESKSEKNPNSDHIEE
jgi:hypothetical protein